MSNMARLRLQEKEQIAIFLRLFIARERALLNFGGFVEVVGKFILLVIIVSLLH